MIPRKWWKSHVGRLSVFIPSVAAFWWACACSAGAFTAGAFTPGPLTAVALTAVTLTAGALTAVAMDPPAPAKTGTAEPPAREQIGSVLGKAVYRDQLKDSPTYSDVVQLFMAPAMKEFQEKNGAKYEMTDDEIRKAAEWQAAVMQKKGGASWERWQKRSDERQKELPERIQEIEAELMNPEITSEEEKALRQALRLAKLEKTVPHASDAWMLLSGRKFEQYLYENYGGGRIILQQLGPEALDARRRLLLELEKAGKFQITDPALRKLAYDYWERPAHPGGFHTDRRHLAFPWTTQFQELTRKLEGPVTDHVK